MEASVIKKGELCIQVVIHRSSYGVTVNVKAHKAVEEFMRNLGDGTLQKADSGGHEWKALEGPPLMVYIMSRPLQAVNYRFDAVGRGLISSGGGDGEKQQLFSSDDFKINLSFLRIPGISEGAGVTFAVKTPYSLEALRRIRDGIATACGEFYKEYIRPVDLVVSVSTQELML